MHKNHYVITLLGVVLHTLVWYELCYFSSKLTEVYFVFVVIDVQVQAFRFLAQSRYIYLCFLVSQSDNYLWLWSISFTCLNT